MLDHRISLPRGPRVTVLGAETLLPHQRRAIGEALECEVTDQYGASEHCGNISECERHRYHEDMEFGLIEHLPLERFAGNVGRIVCTGFWNRAMPLIRYDMGDVATRPAESEVCECGRRTPLVTKIDGRIESYIITPDGRQAGRLDFIFKESENIEEAQLIQNRIDTVCVRVVRGPAFRQTDEQELLKNLRKYLGEVIRLDLEYVPEIPREASGKFRQIVSRVFQDKNRIEEE
jgi:phenylacetate-CoA ligase